MKSKYILLLAIIASLILRVALPFQTIFGSGAVRFTSPDSYYFAIGVRAGAVDPTIHYIKGLYNFSRVSPFNYEIDMILFALAVHLITIPVVYYLARALFGVNPAGVAVVIFAILPGEYLGRTMLGNIDYHGAEALLTTLGMLGIVMFLRPGRRITRAAGLVLSTTAFFIYSEIWSGYILFVPVIAVFGAMWLKQKTESRLVKWALILGGLLAMGLLLQRVLGFSALTWQTTLEARPLLTGETPLFSLLSVIIVFAGVVVCWLEYRRTKESKILLFIIWGVVIATATLLQRRFDYYLVVNAALMMGYLICKIGAAVSENKAGIFTVAITYIICLAVLPGSVRICSEAAHAPPGDWVHALEWVGSNTPEDAVIAAWWDYGYWIKYIAERDSVADPGQGYREVKRVADILTSEESAFDYLILDSATMGINYKTVEYSAKRSGEYSIARRLWSGEKIGNIELVYYNKTLKIFESQQ